MYECQHPQCSFAHSLTELRPPPPEWDKTQGHYWEPGTPKPNPKVKTLIQRYLQKDQDEGVAIPEWAIQLQKAWSDGTYLEDAP